MPNFNIGDKVVTTYRNSLSRQIMTVTSKPYKRGLMLVNVTNSNNGFWAINGLQLATPEEIKAGEKSYD